MTKNKLQGDWQGAFEMGGQNIAVTFNFKEDKDTLSGSLSSPVLNVNDVALENIKFADQILTFEIPQMELSFEGKWENTNIKGHLKQGPAEIALNLTKGKLEKPGDTKLPSTEQELQALAAKATGDFKYKVEDYFAKPKSSQFKLSPDGTYLSFREKDEKLKNHVYVKHIKTEKVQRVITEGEELVRGYGWANDHRLIYVMDQGGNEEYHLFAVDVSGENLLELTPFEGVKVEILNSLKEDQDHMIISMNKNNPQIFDPYRININTGEIVQLYKNEDIANPIMGYEFDKNGELRGFTKLKDGINSELYYKINDEFKLIKSMHWDDSFGIINFDYASENPDEAYVISNLTTDKTEIIKYDLKEGKEIKKLFSHPAFDVSGLGLSRHRNWELDYFSYVGEKFEIIPVSDYFKGLHQRITKEFGDYEYAITGKTDDEQKYLLLISSDKLYGKYYVYDVQKDEFKLLFDLMPQLHEEDMAAMRPIAFESRDGVPLHGYITLPANFKEGNRVPLIVNPHGGPQGIRDVWGFNPEAQLFASRGYATLHVNFRISGGYGKAFFKGGFKQIGRKAMDDVEDGLQYVIDQHWVDPTRVAIYGGSHGGYAVLRGLTKTPDLYACGVDYVGVSNLFTFMQTIPAYWKPYLSILKAVWYDEDIPEEKAIMKEVSPVFHIDKIKKPLFVVQGANDPRVNIDESDQIVRALRDRGIEVPYMVKYDEGHGFAKEENRMELYAAMLGFFAENLK